LSIHAAKRKPRHDDEAALVATRRAT